MIHKKGNKKGNKKSMYVYNYQYALSTCFQRRMISDRPTCKWNVVWQEHYIFAWICYFLFFLILKIDDAPHVDATVNHLEWIEEHNRYRKQPQMDSTPFWSIPTISSKLWVLNKHPLPGVNGFLNWLLNYKNINQFLFEIINLSIIL